MLCIIIIIIVFALPKFKKIQGLTANLNRVIREDLIGLWVVRAYNAEEFGPRTFQKVNQVLTPTNLYVHRLTAIINPAFSGIRPGQVLPAIGWGLDT